MSDKTVTFEGVTFTVPSDRDDLPIEALEAYENERIINFVRLLMGDDKWTQIKRRFTALHSRPFALRDFERLAEELGKVYGFESMGESSASGGSSEKTSDLSRQTSVASTDLSSTKSVSTP